MEGARICKAKRDCPTSILTAKGCIIKALDKFEDPVVAWSGGKCSTVVLHLALQQLPDIRVIFNDTGVEFPETYKFVKRLREEWDLNLETLRPGTTFWEIVKKYGFPMLRGHYKTDSVSKDGRPKCCTLLKEKPVLNAGLECCITGVRVAESRMRMFAVGQRGQYYYAKTLKRWNFHPIAFWTTEEVWNYHEEHQIPHNEIYDKGHDRCGCWPCTGYIGWRESLANSHPKMYQTLTKMKGEPTLWEYMEPEGCRQTGEAW